MNFCISTPVWGDNYVELFLEFCLPSLLTDLSKLDQSTTYYIHTHPDDALRINQSAIFKKLREHITVNVMTRSQPIYNKYQAMTECHQDIINIARSKDYPILFIPPDTIWGHGTIARVVALIDCGRRVIHVAGARLNKDKVLRDRAALGFDADTLATFGLSRLHESAFLHFWNEYEGITDFYPSNIYWQHDKGILLHCFHQHPLLVWPRCDVNLVNTIDDDFVEKAGLDFHDHYISLSFRDILMWEISQPGNSFSYTVKKGDISAIKQWMKGHAKNTHRKLVRQPVWIGERNEQIEREAAAVIEMILA